jgi:hypothetical protein
VTPPPSTHLHHPHHHHMIKQQIIYYHFNQISARCAHGISPASSLRHSLFCTRPPRSRQCGCKVEDKDEQTKTRGSFLSVPRQCQTSSDLIGVEGPRGRGSQPCGEAGVEARALCTTSFNISRLVLSGLSTGQLCRCSGGIHARELWVSMFALGSPVLYFLVVPETADSAPHMPPLCHSGQRDKLATYH